MSFTTRTLSFTISPAQDGKTVKSLLLEDFAVSHSLLSRLKSSVDGITLNGRRVHVRAVAHTSDILTILLDEQNASPVICPIDLPLSICYEDDDLIVLDKPAGLSVHPGSTDLSSPSLAGALAHHSGSTFVPHFVNRLDRGTSGLLIVAKSGYVHDRLRHSLLDGTLRREYRAIAVGQVSPPSGVISLPIARADGSLIKRCVSLTGDAAVTHYESLSHTSSYTLLRLSPETGRTHQLRLHMAAIGFPLVGDWLYGSEDPALITRPALHSYELWFSHPLSAQHLHFTSPLPPDMQALLTDSPNI